MEIPKSLMLGRDVKFVAYRTTGGLVAKVSLQLPTVAKQKKEKSRGSKTKGAREDQVDWKG